jgi:hypothetical protein
VCSDIFLELSRVGLKRVYPKRSYFWRPAKPLADFVLNLQAGALISLLPTQHQKTPTHLVDSCSIVIAEFPQESRVEIVTEG